MYAHVKALQECLEKLSELPRFRDSFFECKNTRYPNLENTENLCYFHGLAQCLLQFPELVKTVLSVDPKKFKSTGTLYSMLRTSLLFAEAKARGVWVEKPGTKKITLEAAAYELNNKEFNGRQEAAYEILEKLIPPADEPMSKEEASIRDMLMCSTTFVSKSSMFISKDVVERSLFGWDDDSKKSRRPDRSALDQFWMPEHKLAWFMRTSLWDRDALLTRTGDISDDQRKRLDLFMGKKFKYQTDQFVRVNFAPEDFRPEFAMFSEVLAFACLDYYKTQICTKEQLIILVRLCQSFPDRLDVGNLKLSLARYVKTVSFQKDLDDKEEKDKKQTTLPFDNMIAAVSELLLDSEALTFDYDLFLVRLKNNDKIAVVTQKFLVWSEKAHKSILESIGVNNVLPEYKLLDLLTRTAQGQPDGFLEQALKLIEINKITQEFDAEKQAREGTNNKGVLILSNPIVTSENATISISELIEAKFVLNRPEEAVSPNIPRGTVQLEYKTEDRIVSCGQFLAIQVPIVKGNVQNGSEAFKLKVDFKLDVPVTHDLGVEGGGVVVEKRPMSLVSALLHIGDSIQSGHYQCLIVNTADGSGILLDDMAANLFKGERSIPQFVKPEDVRSLMETETALLFYKDARVIAPMEFNEQQVYFLSKVQQEIQHKVLAESRAYQFERIGLVLSSTELAGLEKVFKPPIVVFTVKTDKKSSEIVSVKVFGVIPTRHTELLISDTTGLIYKIANGSVEPSERGLDPILGLQIINGTEIIAAPGLEFSVAPIAHPELFLITLRQKRH